MRTREKKMKPGWSKARLPLAALLLAMLAALPAGAEVHEQWQRIVPLNANGSFSLQNINGQVTVLGWERNTVEIDAIKSADSASKLSEARIELNGSGYSVDVETRYTNHHHNNPARVDYMVRVPRGARISKLESVNGNVKIDSMHGRIYAHTVNGKLEVWNAASDLELTAVNGEIKATLTRGNHGVTRLNAVNGNVILGLPVGINARLKISSTNGKIQSELPVSVARPKYGPGMSVNTMLGSGKAIIDLATVNGNIFLRKL